MRPGAALIGVVLLASLPAFASGQPTTTLYGTDGPDHLVGTAGPDALYGGAGDDVLDGAGGDDQLDGGPGADVLNGGAGFDSVVYGGTAPVHVTLDGLPNDGAAGEGDNVGDDVEAIYGGDGADVLTGNSAANLLDGGAGDDSLDGGEGADFLYGGPGDDHINAIDGSADYVDCGDGNDVATVDELDTVVNCETVIHVTPRRVDSTVLAVWEVDGNDRTSARHIRVSRLSGDSTIEVRCRGAGCRRSRVDVPVPRKGSADAASALRNAKLHRHTVVEIRVLEPGAIGIDVRYTMRGKNGPSRRTLCLPPGKQGTVPC